MLTFARSISGKYDREDYQAPNGGPPRAEPFNAATGQATD
jgi:hypothetical protein